MSYNYHIFSFKTVKIEANSPTLWSYRNSSYCEPTTKKAAANTILLSPKIKNTLQVCYLTARLEGLLSFNSNNVNSI